MKEKTPKNNPDNKDIITEIKKEFKRHTGVLMEQMQKEVRTVAEGHSGIIQKLDEHDERFTKIESEVGSIRSEVGSIRSEVGSVKSELQYVKAAVMDTNQTVKSVEKKLNNHETRISKLEEKVHT
ncbi:MAG: hypothetical protein ABIJ27_07295 [Candidatus Omnitrophota bacterium]